MSTTASPKLSMVHYAPFSLIGALTLALVAVFAGMSCGNWILDRPGASNLIIAFTPPGVVRSELLFNQGCRAYRRRYFSEAEESWQLSLSELVNRDGDRYANTANNLAQAINKQGRWKEAEPLFITSLQLKQKFYGEDSPNTIMTRSHLADLYRSHGLCKSAEPLDETALRISRKKYGKDNIATIVCMNKLATTYEGVGRTLDAELLFEKVLDVEEKVLGEADVHTRWARFRLAQFYEAQNRFVDAEPLLQIEVRLNRMSQPRTFSTALSLNALGLNYYEQQRDEDAASVFEEALGMRTLTDERIANAAVMNNLAKAYHRLGRLENAEILYKRSLKIRQEEFDDDYGLIARPMINLALLYNSQKRFAEAEPLLNEAIRIDEAAPEKWEKRISVTLTEKQRKQFQVDIPVARKALRELYNAQGRTRTAGNISKSIKNFDGREEQAEEESVSLPL